MTTQSNTSSALTLNKGISQVTGNYVTATIKKDYSIINLTNELRVRVQGVRQLKKIKSFLIDNGYFIHSEESPLEDWSYYFFIATKK